MIKQVLANKDASPFLCCFVVVAVMVVVVVAVVIVVVVIVIVLMNVLVFYWDNSHIVFARISISNCFQRGV